MLTTYGTRPEHFDTAYPFTTRDSYRVGFKMNGLAKRVADGAAILAGAALMVPCLLVLFSPLIAAAMN